MHDEPGGRERGPDPADPEPHLDRGALSAPADNFESRAAEEAERNQARAGNDDVEIAMFKRVIGL